MAILQEKPALHHRSPLPTDSRSLARTALLVLSLALLGLNACEGSDVKSVRGLVVQVESSSVLEWDSITVRTVEGAELTLLRSDEVDLRFWRASHLREHALRGEAITVSYKRTERGLVATKIDD